MGRAAVNAAVVAATLAAGAGVAVAGAFLDAKYSGKGASVGMLRRERGCLRKLTTVLYRR